MQPLLKINLFLQLLKWGVVFMPSYRKDHHWCRASNYHSDTEHISRHMLTLPCPTEGNEKWLLCHGLSNPPLTPHLTHHPALY